MRQQVVDAQGLLGMAYGFYPLALYLLARIVDSEKARRWLSGSLHKITTIQKAQEEKVRYRTKPGFCLNLAFTSDGLRALGLSNESLKQFSLPYQDGMCSNYRSRILGDTGENRPGLWDWGSLGKEVHLLVMLFTADENSLQEKCSLLKQEMCGGLEIVSTLPVGCFQEREHFGFRDGISQPIWVNEPGPHAHKDQVSAGEFLLGYKNEYGKVMLSPHLNGTDIGLNGSYLVFRQLEQDVEAFWKAAQQVGESLGLSAEEMASKWVGRRPNGEALIPEGSQKGRDIRMNDFTFFKHDRKGEYCPIGSHIRRSNPRDALAETEDDIGIAIQRANKHRILRRGRPYGKPWIPGKEDQEKRGLHFICLNANLERQFEFLQHEWLLNSNFSGLYGEKDPLSHREKSDFSFFCEPTSKRVNQLASFVKLKGGGYFFLPGLKAMKCLSNLA